jgi:dienelactone hydrolase
MMPPSFPLRHNDHFLAPGYRGKEAGLPLQSMRTMSTHLRPPHGGVGLRFCFALLLPITSASSANREVHPLEFKSTVQNLPSENLKGPCSFELSIPSPTRPVRAVWITYDRGYDISRYYSDADVRVFAQKQAIALLLAHQCPAKFPPTGEQGEMDMDMSRGVARSIFAALDDFARQSHHPEIAGAKLIVMGFSGIGAMFGHFVGYTSDRILAAILANPGQTDPYGMKDINLSTVALTVPQFIIAGGIDDRGGTQRPYSYFSRHRARGAPWVFVVQNGIPHCCVINVKPLVLEWLDQMTKLRQPDSRRPLRSIHESNGWYGFIRPCEAVRKDHWGEPLWNVCGASIQPAQAPIRKDQVVGAWFPTNRLALDWLIFIRKAKHPATSFPDGKDALHSEFAIP